MTDKIINLYVVPNCPYCTQVKNFLSEKKINYTVVDVLADNKKRAREMIEKSGQKTVPVLDIEGVIIVGYKPDAILKAVSN